MKAALNYTFILILTLNLGSSQKLIKWMPSVGPETQYSQLSASPGTKEIPYRSSNPLRSKVPHPQTLRVLLPLSTFFRAVNYCDARLHPSIRMPEFVPPTPLQDIFRPPV
jgi:hypothetical protein